MTMPTTAVRALGTTIKQGTTLIGGLTSIGGLELSADTLDITTLDSIAGYREYTASFKDAGEVSVSGFFVPGNAGQAALKTAFDDGLADAYTIEFPIGTVTKTTWGFNGIVTGFVTGSELEDAVSFEATIKVSGQPTLTVGT